MISRQLSYTDDMKDKPLASGSTVANEGMVLVSVIEDGVEKVKLSTGTAGEKVVGISYSPSIVPGQVVASDDRTLDAVTTASSVSFALADVVTGSLRVVSTVAGVATVQTVAASAAAVAAGTYYYADNTLTVWNPTTGADISVTYRKNLTVAEQESLFGNARPNLAGVNAFLGQITVFRGNGEVWTDQYDTTADWSTAVDAVCADASTDTTKAGLLAPGATSSETKTVVGRIVGRPTATNKFLGIAINLA